MEPRLWIREDSSAVRKSQTGDRGVVMSIPITGWLSCCSAPIHPLWRLGPLRRRLDPFRDPCRAKQGLALVLPGIEGQSLVNHDAALGVADTGFRGQIEIFDWTSGQFGVALRHLLDRDRHHREANRLAARIVEHRRRYPLAPVHLLGHSGGGAMVVLALEQLPADVDVDTATLLQAAVSPTRNLAPALARVGRLVNVSSRLDWFFLGVGTSVFRSLDGRRGACAGFGGFHVPRGHETLYQHKLVEARWSPGWARRLHFGGHFGCVNRHFVARHVVPLWSGATPRVPEGAGDTAAGPDGDAKLPRGWTDVAPRRA